MPDVIFDILSDWINCWNRFHRDSYWFLEDVLRLPTMSSHTVAGNCLPRTFLRNSTRVSARISATVPKEVPLDSLEAVVSGSDIWIGGSGTMDGSATWERS